MLVYAKKNIKCRTKTRVINRFDLCNKQDLLKLFLQDIDRKQYPTYSVFEIHPLEGRINPFQGIIFEVK